VLWKATRTVEAIARRNVEALGMGLSDFAVLEALLHKGPLPENALGAKVLLTSGSMTTAVDRLEQRGLVTRESDSRDRRTRLVRLPVRGRRLIVKMFASHQQVMEQAVNVLTARERTVLLDLLRKLGKDAEGLLRESSEKAMRGTLNVREARRRRK
jgi:MarR family 2-MHQ and catechol resistance regulon transcriptional repressor